MEEIRQWAFGICAAAVACGLTQMILPKSSMQRVFGITSSVFFLVCLLSPVALVPLTLDITTQEEFQQEADRRADRLRLMVEEQQKDAISESVRLAAADLLEDMGVEYRKIYINVHEDEEGGISISECEVELDESWFPRHQEIREALLDRLGVNVLIGYKKE